MIPNRSKRGLSTRFRPSAEILEDRSLMAVGQISLYIPSAPVSGGLPPIRGSLPDGSIDVLAYSISSSNPTSVGSAASGTAAGKVLFSPLSLQFAVGSQSPGLFLVESSGSHFNSATLTIRNAAAQVVETITMELVIVATDSSSDSSGDSPMENVGFLYGSEQVTTYNPTTNTMLAQTSWSQVTNSPTLSVPGITSMSLPKASAAHVSGSISAEAVSTSAPTTIKLAVAKSHHGTTVLTAKVASTHGVPTGNVTFYSGKTELGQVAVGSDGKATLSVPTASLGKTKPFAIYSGGPDSTFQPATTVVGEPSFQKSFQKWLGRPMTQDEWVLTSIWSQQGLTLAKMTNIYKSLATKST